MVLKTVSYEVRYKKEGKAKKTTFSRREEAERERENMVRENAACQRYDDIELWVVTSEKL